LLRANGRHGTPRARLPSSIARVKVSAPTRTHADCRRSFIELKEAAVL